MACSLGLVRCSTFFLLCVPATLSQLGCECNPERSSDPPAEARGIQEEQPVLAVSPADDGAPGRKAPPTFVPAEVTPVKGVAVRTSLTDLTGRFTVRPGLVASPCGFYVVVPIGEGAAEALLMGRNLAWSEEGPDRLLVVDGIAIDVGLVSSSDMGASAGLREQELLAHHAQWETAWMAKETLDGKLALKENARGNAHPSPHPAWQIWSATTELSLPLGLAPTRNVTVATVALGDQVLVFRALLAEERQAVIALRRLAFAVDSLELHDRPLRRDEFVQGVEQRASQDPGCSILHQTYGKELGLDAAKSGLTDDVDGPSSPPK